MKEAAKRRYSERKEFKMQALEGRTCTRERSSTNLSRLALNETNLIYASFEGD